MRYTASRSIFSAGCHCAASGRLALAATVMATRTCFGFIEGLLAASASSTTPAAATAEGRIRFRIDDEPIQEEVDRLRHQLDGVGSGVVEGVVGALNERHRRRHVERAELREEVDARLHGNRPVVGAVNEDR